MNDHSTTAADTTTNANRMSPLPVPQAQSPPNTSADQQNHDAPPTPMQRDPTHHQKDFSSCCKFTQKHEQEKQQKQQQQQQQQHSSTPFSQHLQQFPHAFHSHGENSGAWNGNLQPSTQPYVPDAPVSPQLDTWVGEFLHGFENVNNNFDNLTITNSANNPLGDAFDMLCNDPLTSASLMESVHDANVVSGNNLLDICSHPFFCRSPGGQIMENLSDDAVQFKSAPLQQQKLHSAQVFTPDVSSKRTIFVHSVRPGLANANPYSSSGQSLGIGRRAPEATEMRGASVVKTVRPVTDNVERMHLFLPEAPRNRLAAVCSATSSIQGQSIALMMSPQPALFGSRRDPPFGFSSPKPFSKQGEVLPTEPAASALVRHNLAVSADFLELEAKIDGLITSERSSEDRSTHEMNSEPRCAIDKKEDRRRRNREASSRAYYNRKRRMEAIESILREEKRNVTSLYTRMLELRKENASLKMQAIAKGGRLSSNTEQAAMQSN